MELTGSTEGTDKNPKMSLLKQYRDQIVPDFQHKVVDRFNNGGKRKVCIVLQEDGAGLHTDGTYLREKKIFSLRRTGLFLTRSPNHQPSMSMTSLYLQR